MVLRAPDMVELESGEILKVFPKQNESMILFCDSVTLHPARLMMDSAAK